MATTYEIVHKCLPCTLTNGCLAVVTKDESLAAKAKGVGKHCCREENNDMLSFLPQPAQLLQLYIPTL